MNKVDVLYKNYNIQPSGYKDFFKNCDLSLFTTDEKFSKILTKASLTKYAIRKQQRQAQDSKTELITTVFKKHPRNFADEDLVSSDSRESITNDHILQTKFQRHKKSFEQIRKLFPKGGSDEILWEKFDPLNNIKKNKKQLLNESSNMIENNNNNNNNNSNNNNMEGFEKLTNHKKSREKIVEIKNIHQQVSDESLASLENSLIDLHKMPKVKKSREKLDENVQTVNKKTKTNNNCSITDDILGVNLSSILLKINNWVGELSNVINEGILPIDGAEDYIVREKRCKEFATRFSRQYEYEFSRLLGFLRTYAPRITNRLSVNRVAQNITKSCQIILQATMQYCSHIPTTLTSIEKKQYNVHIKFHQMLKNILEFFVLVKKLGKKFLDVRNSLESVEEVDRKCSSILILVEEKFMKQPKSEPKVVKKIVPKDNTKSPYQSSYQNQSIEKRLSMYSMSIKNRSGKTLGPKRINVQSRYKTAGIVKAPVSDNTDQEKKDLEKKKLVEPKRSSQMVCNDSSSTLDPPRINEDEIETMVEKVAKSTKNHLQPHPNNHEVRNKVEILLQSWIDLSNDKKEDTTNNKEMIVTQMLNLFEHLQDGPQKLVSQNLILEKSNSEHEELAKSQISVTGPKNAKLIFIKDKSLHGCLSNTAAHEDNSKKELVKLKTTLTENAMPTILQEENIAKSKSLITKKPMTKAKERSFINILKYRKDFQSYTSHNHMYRKGRVQPWHITNKIAESLLSNILFSVLSEINLDEIVEQIYKAEFE